MRIPELTAALAAMIATAPTDLVLAEACAADLAEHTNTTAAGVAWWVAVCAGVSRDPEPPSIAAVAREATVPAARLHACHLDADECKRVGRAIDAEREAAFGRLLRGLLDRAEEDVRSHQAALTAVSRMPGADTSGMRAALVTLEARRDIFAAALASTRLTPLTEDRAAPLVAVDAGTAAGLGEELAPAPARRRLVCGRCGWRWTSRVDAPRRCPRCQTALAWENHPSAPVTA
jgi:predicted Zn-ribbon and HTH transcriptional regulator